MFDIFREEWIVAVCMFSFLGLSICLRVFLGLLYQNMIRETDNMSSTKNKLLRQCKLKFSNCYQLNNGVANIPIFVDKFINRLALGPISFEVIYHLSGQTMLLSVVSAGAGICRSILSGKMLGEILPFYIVSFVGLYLYFSISTVVDIKGKRRILKVNLVDYLENHLSARIGVTESDMEMLFGQGALPGRERRRRIAAGGGRRTVELMPIGIAPVQQTAVAAEGRNTAPLRATHFDADFSDSGTDVSAFDREYGGAGTYSGSAAEEDSRVTEEELEALLKEFLAT